MDAITFEGMGGPGIKVKLGRRVTGYIRNVGGPVPIPPRWQYFPKGSKTGGAIFISLADCKTSIVMGDEQ